MDTATQTAASGATVGLQRIAVIGVGRIGSCEKPVSLDLSQVERALAAVDEAGVPFQIGFNRRFDPAARVRARRPGVRRRGRRRHRDDHARARERLPDRDTQLARLRSELETSWSVDEEVRA